MAEVNPPPQIVLPEALSRDPAVLNYFQQLDRFLLQIWNRTGGADDAIDNADQNITAQGGRISRNAAKINALEEIRLEVRLTSTSTTTEPFEVLVCNNSSDITVTLDPEAVEGDIVHIKRAGGVVNVVGSIDGKSSKKINIKYYSMQLVYNGTEWNEI